MINRILMTTTAMGLVAVSSAYAQSSIANTLVAQYQAEGFTYIEIDEGPTQIKVEATMGNQTLEVIYDIATLDILKSELEQADADDIGRVGVDYDREDEDFTNDDAYHDDDDDYDDDDGYDDDDYNDDHDDDDHDDDYDDDDDDDDDD